MQKVRKKIATARCKLDDLVMEMAALAKTYEYHPHFNKADQIRKAMAFIQKADHELFMASVAVMET